MRKHKDQIRFVLHVVRELAERDEMFRLAQLAEVALLENEEDYDQSGPGASRPFPRNCDHSH